MPQQFIGELGTMDELLALIRERYMSLSEEEKDDIRRLMGTQEGRVLAKLLGPDLMQQIRLRPPQGASRKRGLAAR